jgi:tripartite-type tricarboxylate transporter receptor subunit TctC
MRRRSDQTKSGDEFRTFAPINLMVTSPRTLVAATALPPSALREIAARAKADPGKAT